MLEYTGWIGTFFTIWGIWLIGKKQRVGFWIGILGGIFWTIKAVYTLQIDLVVVEVLIVLTQIHAWRKWRQDARKRLETN